MKYLLFLLLLLPVTAAQAQSARIIQLPSGQYIGFFNLPNGDVIYLDDVEVKKLPTPVTKATLLVFIMDNDSPNLAHQSEMELAIRDLRKTQTVIQIDESPQTIGTLKQADAIKEAVKQQAPPVIVFIDSNNKLVKVIKMPKTKTEIIKAVD